MIAFFEGIPAGILIGLSFGPAFFMMMQTTLSRGVRQGLYAASGIFLSDFVMFMLSAMSLMGFLKHTQNLMVFALGGGIVLTVLGVYAYVKPPEIRSASKPDLAIAGGVVGKAFLINAMNPFNWLFWVMFTGLGAGIYPSDGHSFRLYFAGVFFTEGLLTMMKVFLSQQIGHWMGSRLFRMFHKIVGIVFLISGLGLIIRVFVF